MPIPIKMPALSPTMTTGHLLIWHKKVNEAVRSGDLLLEIETDKAVMEVEATQSGIMDYVAVAGGTNDVMVGKVIAILRETAEAEGVGKQWLQDQGEDISAPAPAPASPVSTPAPASPVIPSVTMPAPAPAPVSSGTTSAPAPAERAPHVTTHPASLEEPQGGYLSTASTASHFTVPSSTASSRILASPLAKKWAEKHDIPLQCIDGTGPRGRIVKEDVLRVLCHGPENNRHAYADSNVNANANANVIGDARPDSRENERGYAAEVHTSAPIAGNTAVSPAAPIYHDAEPVRVALSGMRKTIAQRLTLSKQTVPHFSLTVACRMDELLHLRSEMNGSEKGLSVNDFMVRACAMALQAVPDMRLMWGDESHALQHQTVDLAVAVSVPGGLITPIVRHADTKSLRALSVELKGLIERARQGRLGATEYQGGLFTLSNLGMMGIDQFTPIINPPHTGILAIGATKKTPVITSDGVCGVGQVMNATVSADHRTIDGSVAALFLTTFQRFVEHPLRLVS